MSDHGSPCLDDQLLAAFITGGLEAAALSGVESHLANCADCRSVVAAAAYGAHESSPGETSSTTTSELARGAVVAGKYRIEGFLGRGGMGVVLAARHLELGQPVALKVLSSSDPAAAARFLREAQTCAQLLNEHIARVFDLGRLPSGVPYFVMEQLVGEDLARVIARGPVAVELVIEYALQVCAALRDAHAVGVIHRDLKPGNLFVTQRSDGKPWIKVLDFGISKRIASLGSQSNESLTSSQAILGSPLYMSPEQVRASKELDVRSDIWSLGVILYELLTGQRPFSGSSVSALLVAIATEAPPPPSSLTARLPEGLEAVVLRCLEKDPAARFPSVVALADALTEVALRPAASGHHASRFEQVLRSAGARRARRWGVAVLAAGSLVWAALVLLRGRTEHAASTSPIRREVESLAPPEPAPPPPRATPPGATPPATSATTKPATAQPPVVKAPPAKRAGKRANERCIPPDYCRD